MRVHELAKELGVTSKELLGMLGELGVEAKSHMSTIDDDAVELIRESGDIAKPAGASGVSVEESGIPGGGGQEDAVDAPAVAVQQTEPTAQDRESDAEPVDSGRSVASQADENREIIIEGKILKARGPLVVKDLAEALELKPNQLIAELMAINVFASINQRVDLNAVRKIAQKHGFEFEHEKKEADYRIQQRRKPDDDDYEDTEDDLETRPPVVTFLGHVDHGKTSLLDRIRNTSVAAGEDGGITQHIGAYTVECGGKKITFLDTPGHAAFTAMRARGANLTDISVIIIAADDGMMPQTREAIMHAKAAGVAIIVAINKVDLPSANVDRVKKQMQSEGMIPEDWGGDVICCPVSAATGVGIEHLLEMILLQAEMLELKANPARRARGFVIESRMEAGKGPIATLLVANGKLKVGDVLVCESHWGRVRALVNDHGAKVRDALPSMPVQCMGFNGVPPAGAEFRVCLSDKQAKDAAEQSAQRRKTEQVAAPRRASLADLQSHLTSAARISFNVILKADTQGSVEAIAHAMQEIKSEKISMRLVLTGTGNVTVNDVMLASASSAVIVGFHVGKESGVDSLARREGVEIRSYQIIYELLDEIKLAMSGMLAPTIQETILGHARIQQVFQVGKNGKVAGCLVIDGMISAKSKVRVKRRDEVLFQGNIISLKRFQDPVSEVRDGLECGIRIDGYGGFESGDILESYETREIKQTL